METVNKINFLKKFSILKQFDDKKLDELAQLFKEKALPSKTTFIEQGTLPDAVFFICEGAAKVYILTKEGKEINLSIMGPGDIVGDIALIDNGPRSASVETLEETFLLYLTKDDFTKILFLYPSITIQMLCLFSSRLRHINTQLEDIVSNSLTDRTWKTLQTLVKHFPNQEITLSHEELANVVGGTRARITEILDHLEKVGKISLSSRKIKLNSFVP